MFDPGNIVHRKPKRSAPVLAMAVVEPSPPINVLGIGKKKKKLRLHFVMSFLVGKEIIFTGKLSIYATISFVTGYMDINCIRRFGVYVTMLTGNLLGGAISATFDTDPQQAILCFAMALCTGILGGMFSCFVLERTQCKKKAFFWIMLCSTISVVFTDICEYYGFRYGRFAAILLAIASGGTVHWVLKFGFSPAFMTVNSLKLAEALYRFLFGINQGGAKLRGDLIVLVTMFSCFIFGSIVAYIVQFYMDYFTMCPILIFPIYQVLHLHDFFTYKPGDGTTVWSRSIRTYHSIFTYPPDAPQPPPLFSPSMANRNTTATRNTTTTLNIPTTTESMISLTPTVESSSENVLTEEEEADLESCSDEMTPYERETYIAEKRASRIRNSNATAGRDSANMVGVYRGTMASVVNPMRQTNIIRPPQSELRSPLVRAGSPENL
jgi:hypothetical protein